MTSDIIRNETAHAVLGVPGRLFTLRRPPAPWVPGVFANQTWVSEARPIKGYGAGGSLQVEMRFDDDCRNGRNSFAITGTVRTNESRRRNDIQEGGCLHEDIAQVFPELAPLIRWHLTYTDGPMYYIENTLYHADAHGATHAWVYFTGQIDPLEIGETKERLLTYAKADEARKAEGAPGYRVQWDEKTVKLRNLEHARSSACWADATDAQMMAPRDELKAALLARLPALMAEFRAAMEGAGFMWECPAPVGA